MNRLFQLMLFSWLTIDTVVLAGILLALCL
jgi:hypothetical protein